MLARMNGHGRHGSSLQHVKASSPLAGQAAAQPLGSSFKRPCDGQAAALQTVGETSCSALQYRWNTYKSLRERIDKDEGGLEKFTQGEKQHGCHQGTSLPVRAG